MYLIKLQIEIRYAHVLNFREIYQSIVSPFIPLCKFTIENQGTYEEHIVLKFKEEQFVIDFRWDRVVVFFEQKMENFFASNGPLLYFFQIIEKLKNTPGFEGFLQLVLAEWHLLEKEKSFKDINDEFRQKYYVTIPTLDRTEIDDCGILINYKEKDDLIKLQYGPFKQTDIENFNLDLDLKNSSKLHDKNGILIQTIYFSKNFNPNLDAVKNLDKKIIALNNQIS